jgi:hypothetical protein
VTAAAVTLHSMLGREPAAGNSRLRPLLMLLVLPLVLL